METIRYSLLGAQDIKAGFGTFEVVLADGRTVVLDDLNTSHLLPAYQRLALPTPGVAGRLARVTDDVRGLWMDTGTNWFGIAGEWANVKEFGAQGDGTTDDTAAIQAAITAAPYTLGAGNVGGVVYFPPGTYKVTSTLTISEARTLLLGCGKQASVLSFQPTANGDICLHFTAGASILYQCAIKGFGFSVGGAATGKIGIQLDDVSEFLLEDVAMQMATTGASVGVKIRGRDFITVNRLEASAVQPLIISENLNQADGGCDHGHFHDCYLLATTASDCVTIEDGAGLSNVTFDGYQSWIFGRHGFSWVNTKLASDINLVFKNVRHEQSTDTAGYIFNFDRSAGTTANVLFENIYGGLNARGFYLRSMNQVTLRHVHYVNTASNTFLDVDGTVNPVVLENVVRLDNTVVNFGTLRRMWAIGADEIGGVGGGNQFRYPHVIYALPAGTGLLAPTIAAGRGTGTYRPSGILNLQATDVATSGTTEEILHTYTLPADTLNANLRGIRVTATLFTAANANAKIARIRFNGIAGSIVATVTTSDASAFITLQALIVRTGASAESFGGFGLADVNLSNPIGGTAAVSTTGAITIVVTGETVTAAADLTARITCVELL